MNAGENLRPRPVNKGFAITTLWAFVAVAGDADEGLAAVKTTNGWVPMVASDRRRVESLLPMARALAAATGQRIELRRWDGPRVLETTIEP